MSIREIAFEIEDLQIKAEKADSLQMALWQAIYRGDFKPDSYEWTFLLLGDLTTELKEQLQSVIDKIFNAMKEEVQENEE